MLNGHHVDYHGTFCECYHIFSISVIAVFMILSIILTINRNGGILSALRNRRENAALSVRAISAEKRGGNQAHETDCPYGTGRSAPH